MVVAPKRFTLEPAPAVRPNAPDLRLERLVQAWLDAVLRVALARVHTSDEGSLPGLTFSLSAAHRLLARQSAEDEQELVALEAVRDTTTAQLSEALRDGTDEFRLSRLVRALGLSPTEWQRRCFYCSRPNSIPSISAFSAF